MKIDCAIKSRRIQAVKLANALNTIEGVPVSDYAKELSQQWANGEICEECVINISAMMDMSSPAVSHHLRQLKNAGLIVVKDFLIPYQLNFKVVKSDGLLAHRFLHAARQIDSTLCIDCSRIKGGTP